MRHLSASAVLAAATTLRHALEVLTENEEPWAAKEVAKALDLVHEASAELTRRTPASDGA